MRNIVLFQRKRIARVRSEPLQLQAQSPVVPESPPETDLDVSAAKAGTAENTDITISADYSNRFYHRNSSFL